MTGFERGLSQQPFLGFLVAEEGCPPPTEVNEKILGRHLWGAGETQCTKFGGAILVVLILGFFQKWLGGWLIQGARRRNVLGSIATLQFLRKPEKPLLKKNSGRENVLNFEKLDFLNHVCQNEF